MERKISDGDRLDWIAANLSRAIMLLQAIAGQQYSPTLRVKWCTDYVWFAIREAIDKELGR